MKRLLSAILAMLTVMSATAYALPIHSDWAEDSIVTADNAGLFVNMNTETDFTKAIKRERIAELVVLAYENIMGKVLAPTAKHFADTKTAYPDIAYHLGLMNGTGDDTFSPDDYTTREAMAKIILTLKSKVEENVSIPLDPKSHFNDFSAVSEWARPYVAEATDLGIINGFEDITFRPLETVSYQEAVVLLSRSVSLKNVGGAIEWIDPTAPPREIDIRNKVSSLQAFGYVRVRWSGGSYADVRVTEARNSYYPEDIAPRTLTYAGNGYIDIMLNPNRRYEIDVIGVKTVKFSTPSGDNDGAEEIAFSYPKNKEEADALQVDVTVPVWRVKNGKKYEGAVTLVVHKDIAERVELVFEDIFNGEEKFPIKSIGAYAWRGDGGEHNGGTAIDINADENYCLYGNGTIIGKYWRPYEDEFSITPYGDVVNAFEKYGFTWGGDAWRNPRDYMHFSYLGR